MWKASWRQCGSLFRSNAEPLKVFLVAKESIFRKGTLSVLVQGGLGFSQASD